MTGEVLRQSRAQVRRFLGLYGILAVAGCAIAARSVAAGQPVPGAAGFMVVFGAGMAALTFARGRQPQVVVSGDFLEVHQSRAPQCVRYRNITAVTRPDGKRLVVTLREEGGARNVTIWLQELDPADVRRLQDFLVKMRGSGR